MFRIAGRFPGTKNLAQRPPRLARTSRCLRCSDLRAPPARLAGCGKLDGIERDVPPARVRPESFSLRRVSQADPATHGGCALAQYPANSFLGPLIAGRAVSSEPGSRRARRPTRLCHQGCSVDLAPLPVLPALFRFSRPDRLAASCGARPLGTIRCTKT